MSSRVLFILKRRLDFNAEVHNKIGLSTGLYNSAKFVNDMLVAAGVESNIEVAVDNNCIDRLVTKYQPTHVIIEALWVVPEKFSVLQRLHPTVTWILRLHSETPFIASEGIAMDWIAECSGFRNMVIACNAPRFLGEMRNYCQTRNAWPRAVAQERVFYLPNYYPTAFKTKTVDRNKPHVDIACFGAVRPLKNHVLQALAAVQFAEEIGKSLRFHINAGRIEMNGAPVMNNLKGLFQQLHSRGHEMVIHQWSPHEEFVKICADIDIGLQVSFSETFNIVGADLIAQGVPVVGSTEIPWASTWFCADPCSQEDILRKLHRTWTWPGMNVWQNQRNLDKYSSATVKTWVRYFKESKK